MLRELARGCEDASWDDDIRVVVLTGACRAIFVGDRRAREIIMLSEEIPAAQAADWGLINRAVPSVELDAAVDEYVKKLAAKLPQTTRYAKQQLNFWRDLSWHETVNLARDW